MNTRSYMGWRSGRVSLFCSLVAACDGSMASSPPTAAPAVAGASGLGAAGGTAASPAANGGVAGTAEAGSGGTTAGASSGSSPVTSAGSAGMRASSGSSVAGSSAAGSNAARSSAAGSNAAGSESPRSSRPVSGSDCSGRFATAILVELEMGWPDSIGVAAGTGTLESWAKTTFTPTGDSFTTESRACGFALPAMTTTPLLEGVLLGNDFPASAFESPTMPNYTGTASRQDGSWVLSPGASILGVTLTDPTAAWPAPHLLMPSDHDGDGKPGITVFPKEGGGFGLPPTRATLDEFADQLYIAARFGLRVTAQATGCEGLVEGTVEPLVFDFTTLGCHIKDGGECAQSAPNLFNRFLPALEFGTKGKATMVPIAESASCADVRQAIPRD